MSVPANSTVTKLTTQAPDGERLLTKYQASRLQSSNSPLNRPNHHARCRGHLEATAGLIIKREENFVAFKSQRCFDSAEGFFYIPIEQGQPLFLTGHASADRSGRKRFTSSRSSRDNRPFTTPRRCCFELARITSKNRAPWSVPILLGRSPKPDNSRCARIRQIRASHREKIAVACRDAF